MIEIGGLPAHILLVHAVVVLAPIAGLGAIVYAAAPRWRTYLAWPLGVLSLGLVPVTLLTAQAGEQLEKARPASALIHEHAQQGDVLKVVSVIFFVLVAAMLVVTYEPFGRRLAFLGGLRDIRSVRVALLIAGVVTGAFFIYQSIITGHSGAASVWAR
ncbi:MULTISPECIES: DUF2231 domain-containing protein [unclassified Arthrobacter]|uniref:DUF2231 domain-containing protein n=1 Tax=unclassified Arthrobacter TaxID=235627 RepID=UPI001D524DA3|nr:DUF2231 domain-containing protein [Arthrobacter sp. Bi26]CAH0160188.1 hypothetical protein SRABI26_00933 [Arthrobacter sp. Bi26]